MQVGVLGSRGAARIQHDVACAARGTRGDQPLVQHWMAPGGIAADQYDQVRFVPVSASSQSLYTPGTTSSPNARTWPATDEAMQS